VPWTALFKVPGTTVQLLPSYSSVAGWDGSSWTTGGSLVIPEGLGCNSGPQTASIVASGYSLTAPWGPGNVTESQTYDGSAWSTAPSVATARSSAGSSNRGNGGGTDGALIFSGNTNTAEEFTAETTALGVAQTITTS